MIKQKSEVKYQRYMSIMLTVVMLFSLLCACKKVGDENNQPTESAANKTTAAAKSTSKTSATVKNNTNSSTKDNSEKATTNTDSEGRTSGERVTEGKVTEDVVDGIGDHPDGSSTGSSTIDENYKIYDLKGRTIKVVVWNEGLIPSSEHGRVGGPKMYKLLKEAEEKFNCKFAFEIVPEDTVVNSNLKNSVLAGVYYADIVRMDRWSALPVMEKENVIMPINDYIDFSRPVYKMYDQVNGVVNPDKIYAFFNSTPLTPTGVWYNKEIMDREGITDLKEYYNKGSWNWETFADIAIRTTHDLNGDGIIDQWGVGSESTAIMATSMMRSNLASMIDYVPAENKYRYNLKSPQALKALQFLSDLYHTYKVLLKGNGLNDFRAGKVAMYVREAWYGLNFQTMGLTNLGFTILPSGPDNQENTFMREQGSHFFFFPSNIENPAAVVNAAAYWNVTWDDSKSEYLNPEELYITEAKRYFNLQDNIDFYINYVLNHRVRYDYIEYFKPSREEITKAVFNQVSTVQMSPVSSIEATEKLVQSIIDDIMSK